VNATVGTVALTTTHTDAGTYNTDSWSFTGTANYNNISSTTITDTILQLVTGSIAVDGFVGGFLNAVIVATDSSDLPIGEITLNIAPSGGNGSYSVGVPPNTAHLSVKPHLYLRKRQDVTFVDPNQLTLDFTGDNKLLGGDANDDNKVDGTDYAWLRAYWGQNGPVVGYDTNGRHRLLMRQISRT